MSAVMDGDEPQNLKSATAYVDDLHETAGKVSMEKVILDLTESFVYKRNRASMLGLSFAPDKSELIHFSLAKRRAKQDQEYMTVTDVVPPVIIQPSEQIKLFGVIVEDTLNFIVHAQHAASKATQTLGTLLYLRNSTFGITPRIARYLAISKILPKLFWASPIW